MVVPNLYGGSEMEKGEHPWHFCYLHGEAENLFPPADVSPDIFMADQPMPTRPGSYPVTIHGFRGIAVIAERFGRLGGRVVLVHDFPALQHATRPEDWG